jgi:hypothetical protein
MGHTTTLSFDPVERYMEHGGTLKHCHSHILVFAFVPLLLLGCSDGILDTTTVGNTTLTIEVDLLAYLDDSQKTIEYGQDPQVLGDLGIFELRTPTQSIDISGEFEDVHSIESVEMLVTVVFHNETGTADLTYNTYLSAMDEDPYDTTPVISEAISLDGTQDVTSDIGIEGDQRLIDLFEVGIMQYCAQFLFEITEGSKNLSGVAEVVRFDMTVVTTL